MGDSPTDSMHGLLFLELLLQLETETKTRCLSAYKKPRHKASLNSELWLLLKGFTISGLARLCLRPESASEILRLGGLERLGEVARQEMFDDDETVKLAVVAAVTSVNTDFSESFV